MPAEDKFWVMTDKELVKEGISYVALLLCGETKPKVQEYSVNQIIIDAAQIWRNGTALQAMLDHNQQYNVAIQQMNAQHQQAFEYYYSRPSRRDVCITGWITG